MKIFKSVVLGFLFFVTLGIGVFADNHTGEEMHNEKPSVVEIAMSSDVHTTLVTAVVEAELADTLSGEGPFTVFAPTNMAFDMLPAGTVEMLFMPDHISHLQEILTYHVVPGKIMAEDLSHGLTIPTVQGDEVTFTYMNGNWYINSAMISAANLEASNGVVHVIDSVIMPPKDTTDIAMKVFELRGEMDEMMEEKVDNVLMKYSQVKMNLSSQNQRLLENIILIKISDLVQENMADQNIVNMLSLVKYEIMLGNEMAQSIVDIAMNTGMHNTLVTAVLEADLAAALSADGPFTVFAPIDDAFAALPEGTLESLLMQESKEDLTNILTYHVVPGSYFAADITDGLELETLNGTNLMFSIEDGEVFINGMPSLVMTDVVGSNGVIHVIDTVLLP